MKFSDRTPRQLILGETYFVSIWGKPCLCTFIQPTLKGYNLLDINTSKCVLTRHIYPSKAFQDNKTFFVNRGIKINHNPFPKAV